jgi:hypothetical protein
VPHQPAARLWVCPPRLLAANLHGAACVNASSTFCRLEWVSLWQAILLTVDTAAHHSPLHIPPQAATSSQLQQRSCTYETINAAGGSHWVSLSVRPAGQSATPACPPFLTPLPPQQTTHSTPHATPPDATRAQEEQLLNSMPLGQATVAGFLSNNTWYVLAKPAAAAKLQESSGKCLVSVPVRTRQQQLQRRLELLEAQPAVRLCGKQTTCHGPLAKHLYACSTIWSPCLACVRT